MKMFRRVAALAAALAASACAHQSGPPVTAFAAALRETPPVGVTGDAADDPAIYVAEPAAESVVIGTQKQGGLFVYNLAGDVVQSLPGGRPNNVDLRDGFPFARGPGALVATSDRTDNAIVLWRLDPQSKRLDEAALARVPSGFAEVYGVCVGRDVAGFVVVATSTAGDVGIWRVTPGAAGPIGEKIGGFKLSSITEGCVVDDAAGVLYVAEENVGIWRTPLASADGAERRTIDAIRKGGPLAADIEGLAIWRGAETSYLLASVQGRDAFAVYDLSGENAYLGSFKVGPSSQPGAADAVSGTDGIDVVSADLGPDYPRGLFVAQDDENSDPTATQNFKLVSWAEIERALGLTQ